MMTRFIVCIGISLFLCSCSSTKNWQGTSNSQVAQAEFKELNGKQTFTLHVPDNDTYLAYQFKETDGQLEAIIKSASERIFDQKIESSEADSFHLVNQKGAEYKVTIKGKHASGAFYVRFESSK
ncbi:hypothetical protein GO755_27100 [Spirosoma sp. HMF4905]|uniref:Lipoprotein n=1 Tax=Spirosoma arboris TaxID=2682092 RepID=A0A7K1SIZ2_9BACT|nr:hypothetical protein [Spirosoma arboris]MVM33735.1 hypothetical protein [Spirosoma arboris]